MAERLNIVDMFRRDLLQQRLVGYAHWYVAKKGYRFGPGAEQAIENMISAGVTKVRRQISGQAAEDAERMVKRAEASIKKLVDRMILEIPGIKGYARRNPQVVGEETLARALSGLCPLWPIC